MVRRKSFNLPLVKSDKGDLKLGYRSFEALITNTDGHARLGGEFPASLNVVELYISVDDILAMDTFFV